MNSKLWFHCSPAHRFTGVSTMHFRHIGIMSEVCFYVLFCQTLSYPWLFSPIKLLEFSHPAVSSPLWVSLFLPSLTETFSSPHIALQYPFVLSSSAQVVISQHLPSQSMWGTSLCSESFLESYCQAIHPAMFYLLQRQAESVSCSLLQVQAIRSFLSYGRGRAITKYKTNERVDSTAGAKAGLAYL